MNTGSTGGPYGKPVKTVLIKELAKTTKSHRDWVGVWPVFNNGLFLAD